MPSNTDLANRLEYRFVIPLGEEAFIKALRGKDDFRLPEYELPVNSTIYLGNLVQPWFPVKGTSMARLRIRMRSKECFAAPVAVLDQSAVGQLEVKGAGGSEAHKIKIKSCDVQLGDLLVSLSGETTFSELNKYFRSEQFVFDRDIYANSWPHMHGLVPLAMTQYRRREAIHKNRPIRITIDFDTSYKRIGKVKKAYVAREFRHQSESVVEVKAGPTSGITCREDALRYLVELFPTAQVMPTDAFVKFDVCRDYVNEQTYALREVKPDAAFNRDTTEYEFKYYFPDKADIFNLVYAAESYPFYFQSPEDKQNYQRYIYDPSDDSWSVAHNTGTGKFKYKKRLSITDDGIILSTEHFAHALRDISSHFSLHEEALEQTSGFNRVRQTTKVISTDSGYTYVVVADIIYIDSRYIFQELEIEFNGIITDSDDAVPHEETLLRELRLLDKIVRKAWLSRGVRLSPKSHSKFQSILEAESAKHR